MGPYGGNDSKFLGHEPCPSCGSRDNLARYSDGHAWCFGCGYRERGTRPPLSELFTEPKVEIKTALQTFPSDVTRDLGMAAKAWLLSYGIREEEWKKHGYLWSPSKEWLIYPMYQHIGTQDADLIAFQARQFRKDASPKYLTFGQPHKVMTVVNYDSPDNDVVVLVEDMVSAIKVGRLKTTLCLFGSHIGNLEVANARLLAQKAIVWLDYDKKVESMTAASRMNATGLPTSVIITTQDPKACSMADIEQKLEDAKELLTKK